MTRKYCYYANSRNTEYVYLILVVVVVVALFPFFLLRAALVRCLSAGYAAIGGRELLSEQRKVGI